MQKDRILSHAARAAPEGDGARGRDVREQGTGMTVWNYDGSGRSARSFTFWIAEKGEKSYNIRKANGFNKNQQKNRHKTGAKTVFISQILYHGIGC